MPKKYFTPQEANKRLPLIKKIVTDILEKGKRAKMLLQTTGNDTQEISSLEAQMEILMIELEELGCYFKDWNYEIGLVDFPAVIDGQEVMLCWRSDEPRVEWYHGILDGYAGRQKIPPSS